MSISGIPKSKYGILNWLQHGNQGTNEEFTDGFLRMVLEINCWNTDIDSARRLKYL